MTFKRWLPLGLFLLLAFAAGAIGAYATFSSVKTWYPTLHKPDWTPPSSVFSPVWTFLYIAMSVAAWRVWQIGGAAEARQTFRLFAAQLGLNALWSVFFFGMQQPGLALLDILVLWLVLLRIFVRFWRLDRVAGLLWTPYVLWVTFAAALNFAIWERN